MKNNKIKENIRKQNKDSAALYKETQKCGLGELTKKAIGGYKPLIGGAKKIINKKPRTPNLGEQISSSGPLNSDKMKTYFKIGAGLTAAGGLAALAKS